MLMRGRNQPKIERYRILQVSSRKIRISFHCAFLADLAPSSLGLPVTRRENISLSCTRSHEESSISRHAPPPGSGIPSPTISRIESRYRGTDGRHSKNITDTNLNNAQSFSQWVTCVVKVRSKVKMRCFHVSSYDTAFGLFRSNTWPKYF